MRSIVMILEMGLKRGKLVEEYGGRRWGSGWGVGRGRVVGKAEKEVGGNGGGEMEALA
jgi:hypothetical protein